jgi:hypothetical protein
VKLNTLSVAIDTTLVVVLSEDPITSYGLRKRLSKLEKITTSTIKAPDTIYIVFNNNSPLVFIFT